MGDSAKEELMQAAYDKAVWILGKCSTGHGFYAAYPGYDMVFARDSMIMSLGASLVSDKKMKIAIKESIDTLADFQSEHGQIPNAVDKYSDKRKHHVDFQSIDSTLWWMIGNYYYAKRYNEPSILKKNKARIERSFHWLACQDMGEDTMPEQLPTTDWQDAFPHRYGHTINTQALYYYALRLFGKIKEANKLKEVVNRSIQKSDLGLWDNEKGFYVPWRWKNHGKYHELGEWFDTLANILAILFGLADDRQSNRILNYIEKHNIQKPYPIKVIWPAIYPKSKDWQDYFKDCGAGKPWHYSNAGIWTFVGGFYVLALIKMKRFAEARQQMEKLAEANMKNHGNFSEWLNGKTGKIGRTEAGVESYQGWNAALYVLAYESLKKKRVLL